MGITELSNALNIDKSVVSRLVKKGMPTTSVDAAQAWRETNAPPRAKRGHRGTPPPAPKVSAPPAVPTAPPVVSNDTPPPPPQHDSGHEPDDEDNTPRQSLRRARLAEKVGYNELVLCKRNGGSIEDIRKANQIYIASRNNRIKAEKDFKDWQLQERKLLYYEEACEITGRPHQAERMIIENMPKTIAPQVNPQNPKLAEIALTAWVDRLFELRRKSF